MCAYENSRGAHFNSVLKGHCGVATGEDSLASLRIFPRFTRMTCVFCFGSDLFSESHAPAVIDWS